MTTKAEPRFDIDLKYGVGGEVQVQQLLDWVVSGNGLVEVKRKRILDLWFFVETHCDKGRHGTYQPSGISVTTASTWFFVLGDSGITVSFPTDVLRAMLNDASVRDKEEMDGLCPTKGKLINLSVLLFRYKQHLDQIKAAPPAPTPAKPNQPYKVLTADDIDWGFQ